MPFKIIETIERGRRLIETVPSSWESDGNLYWPRKNFMSLKKNEESTPQPDWKCLPCILLRDNILGYKAAELEIALMSDATDTDDKENENPRKKTSVGSDFNNLVMECIQLNKVAEEEESLMVTAEEASLMVTAEEASLMVTTEEASPMVTTEDATSVMVLESNTLIPMDVNNIIIQDLSQEHANNPTEIKVLQDSILKVGENLLLPDSNLRFDPQIADTQTPETESTKVLQQIGYLTEMVSTVQENQKVLFENQNSTLKALALLNTKIEEFVTRSQVPVQNEQYKASSSFKTLNNIEELTAFEEQLKKPLMETKYIQELSIICSEKKTGYNNAYALVDAMFDRKLMTCCSWGGGTKGEPKHCFKAFTKTINLFLKVVHQYDKTFTKPICEDFFKNVLRHSAKRSIAKRVRDSTTKKKIKKSEAINELQERAGAGPSNHSNPTQ